MQIEYQSDVGRRRNTNQDYASVFTSRSGLKLAVLADGMGGHRAGDIASQMAVTNLGEAWEEQEAADDEKNRPVVHSIDSRGKYADLSARTRTAGI
ncbi:protein phosphatase 2C domain-containing protein [Enterococcus lactis]|nr:protein phosphatase 2C domain-containing protein [Enterococcus lactis]